MSTDITMPSAFPEKEFRAFGLSADKFFPGMISDESLADPEQKQRQFQWSWQAVRYRYRSCVECEAEFRALLKNPSRAWQSGWGDEELNYKLERSIYVFFMSGLSVFDSFFFCLYFLGNAIQPTSFRDVANPRNITRSVTHKAFNVAFPQEGITGLLGSLSGDARFSAIDRVRNLLGHRVSGRRSVRTSSTINGDGTQTTDFHEETWHIPGAPAKLMFNNEMLQHHLDDTTALLSSLVRAAQEFAESRQRAGQS